MFEKIFSLGAAIVATIGPPLGVIVFAVKNEFGRVWGAVLRLHKRVDDTEISLEKLENKSVTRDEFVKENIAHRNEVQKISRRLNNTEKDVQVLQIKVKNIEDRKKDSQTAS